MALPDVMGSFLEQYGKPQQSQPVFVEEAERYRGQLPSALINFWLQHGRGSYLDGKFWLCEPKPLASVLQEIFKDDAEFLPEHMCIYAYTAFGHCWVSHPRYKIVTLDFVFGQIFATPENSLIDVKTGNPYPDEFILGNNLHEMVEYDGDCDQEGKDLLPQAIEILGHLDPGEIYGFFPPPCLGGLLDVTTLRKTPAIEHLNFLAQACDFQIVELTEPSAANPFGELVPVRRPGSR